MNAIIDNSSSGLTEAPSFKIGTINIGDRQAGRIKADSVIDCEPYKNSIQKAFEKLYSSEFQTLLKTVKNPYGEGCVSKEIIKILLNTELNNLLKKKFYDLKDKQ
jgi:GDP/UDP-N,N'-diacetylbacillosamine 2-epimerase (hydrolysing)